MALQGQAGRRLALEQVAHLVQALGRDVEDARGVDQAQRRSSGEQHRHEVAGESGVSYLRPGASSTSVEPSAAHGVCGRDQPWTRIRIIGSQRQVNRSNDQQQRRPD